LAIHEKLLAQGILTGAIRPPSVPKATDRLRITLTAGHSEEQLDRLLAALEQILAKQPLTPAHGVETALTQKAEKIID
jgi:8-amino-7-oxononanoate synthase